jgi:hypothetical protein
MARTKHKKGVVRIDWGHITNLDCIHLVNHGLHADAIARATGLSRGQVYYRAKRVGVRLRDYRDGRGPIASVLFRNFTVKKMTVARKETLRASMEPVVTRRLQERSKKK